MPPGRRPTTKPVAVCEGQWTQEGNLVAYHLEIHGNHTGICGLQQTSPENNGPFGGCRAGPSGCRAVPRQPVKFGAGSRSDPSLSRIDQSLSKADPNSTLLTLN